MTITVFARHRDYINFNALSFSDDDIIGFTKELIRRLKMIKLEHIVLAS